MPLDEGQVPYV